MNPSQDSSINLEVSALGYQWLLDLNGLIAMARLHPNYIVYRSRASAVTVSGHPEQHGSDSNGLP